MLLDLSAETNKKKGSNMVVEEEILLIEEFLTYEGTCTLFGKMWGLKGGGVSSAGCLIKLEK